MPMKKLFPLLGLLLLVSCATGKRHRVIMPPMPPMPSLVIKSHSKAVMSPRGAELFKLSIGPSSTKTNTVPFSWTPPNTAGLIGFNFYYGTNSGSYLSRTNVGNVSAYNLDTLIQTISTNPIVRVRQFPDGRSYTNCNRFYFVVTALYDKTVLVGFPTNSQGYVESAPSNEVPWPPLPPPPWTALIFSWGTNTPGSNSVFVPLVRNVTIQQATNLVKPVWKPLTNSIGTNVTVPLPPSVDFFRAVTTNQPPLILRIQGGYL